jgi:hypothetical protein
MHGASACVGLHCLIGEKIAFREHFFDLVNGLPPVAGRTARSQRRQELVAKCCFLPVLPSHQTLGLVGKVLEGGLEGLEPPSETLGIDQAIGQRRGAPPQAGMRETWLPPGDRIR